MVQQRHEMYRPIHKALRHMMVSTAQKLGIADFRDDSEARDAIASLERTINLLIVHAEHEDSSRHTKQTIRTMTRSMPSLGV